MKHFRFFQNTECEYFPCHKTSDPTHVNCLFCYCPLYFTGQDCGGSFTLTKKGIKDCSDCLLPHGEGGYDFVKEKLDRILEEQKNKT